MARLTKRDKVLRAVDKDGTEHWNEFINVSDRDEADEKLLQLEDIEDELGIDLLTLFKAMKNGFWGKGEFYGTTCPNRKDIHFSKPEDIFLAVTWYDEIENEDDYQFSFTDEHALCLFEMNYENIVYEVRVKDYGRTWALTREELE